MLILTSKLIEIVRQIQTNILDKIDYENMEKDVETKGKSDYVTTYDKKIEGFLKEKLTELIPGSTFIGEESGEQKGENRTYTWIVDPIDGTTNFIHQLPYTISIALVKDGHTQLGLVYDASTKQVYYAEKGKGSYLDENQINSGKRKQVENSVFAYGYPYDQNKTRGIVEKVIAVKEKGAADIKRIGPSSLDICKVASGQLEGYFEYDLQPWDVAAAVLILQEAGGRLIKMDGQQYDYKKSGIIATNQSEELQKELYNIVGEPAINIDDVDTENER